MLLAWIIIDLSFRPDVSKFNLATFNHL